MPKAILELEMPESCWECELYSAAHNCCSVIVIVGHYALCPDKGKRADCPLKLVEEKQIPKKVIEAGKYGIEKSCPNCKSEVKGMYFYCTVCGQRLSW